MALSPLISLLSFNLSATDTINSSASQPFRVPRHSCKAYNFKAHRVIDHSREGTADKSDYLQRSSKDYFHHKGRGKFRKKCRFNCSSTEEVCCDFHWVCFKLIKGVFLGAFISHLRKFTERCFMVPAIFTVLASINQPHRDLSSSCFGAAFAPRAVHTRCRDDLIIAHLSHRSLVVTSRKEYPEVTWVKCCHVIIVIRRISCICTAVALPRQTLLKPFHSKGPEL